MLLLYYYDDVSCYCYDDHDSRQPSGPWPSLSPSLAPSANRTRIWRLLTADIYPAVVHSGFGINVLVPRTWSPAFPYRSWLSQPLRLPCPVLPLVGPALTSHYPRPFQTRLQPAIPLRSHRWGDGGGDVCPGSPGYAEPCLCISTFTLQWLSPLTHQLVNKLQNHASSLWHFIKQPI